MVQIEGDLCCFTSTERCINHCTCTYTGRGNMFLKRGMLGQSQEKERCITECIYIRPLQTQGGI